MKYFSIFRREIIIVDCPLQPLCWLTIFLGVVQTGIFKEFQSNLIGQLNVVWDVNWTPLVLLALIVGVLVYSVIVQIYREDRRNDIHLFRGVLWPREINLGRIKLNLWVIMTIRGQLGRQIFINDVINERRNFGALFDQSRLLNLKVSKISLQTFFHSSFLNRIILKIRLFNLNGEGSVAKLFLTIVLLKLWYCSLNWYLVDSGAWEEGHFMNFLEQIKPHDHVNQNRHEAA